MKKARLATATVLTAVLASGVMADAGAQPTSLMDGVYTAEQAATGKPLFEQNCSTCHNADYYKTVLQTWRGQPLMYLFEQVMSAMPADKPGALMDSEYEDVFAYVLQIVGFPAGETRLQYAGGSMEDIAIQTAP
jgi:mono/diheme cytochrome c family protein